MNTRSNSLFTYRSGAMATLLVGIVLALLGFAMGGFTSVTWAGFMGAGIALTVHGLIATIGSLMTPSSRERPQQTDAESR